MNLIEEQTKAGHPATPSAAADQSPQDIVIQKLQHFRLREGSPELPERENRRKIEQCSLNSGAGDAVDAGAICEPQHPVTMGCDTGGTAAPATGGRDVNSAAAIGSETPKGGSRAMRKNRGTPTGQDRSHESTFDRQSGMSYREDAVVDSV
jgi:hypothetical protein